MRRTHHPLRHAHHSRPASTRTRAAQEKNARAATAKATPARLSAPRCYPATTRVTRRPPRGSGRPLEASGNLVAGVSGNATHAGTNHKETAETCWKNLCKNPPYASPTCASRTQWTSRPTAEDAGRPGGAARGPEAAANQGRRSSHRRPGNGRPPTSLIFSMETRPRGPGPATGSKRVLPKAYSTGATA